LASRDLLTLPLLVVPHVLFPGSRLQLTLTQPESIALLEDVIQRDSTFVVVSEKPNQELFPVGTTARVVESLRDATAMTITVVGVQRVSLLSYRHQGARLVGQCRYAVDQDDAVPPPLTEEAWALGSELFGAVAHGDRRALPQNATGLSYWIAAHVPLALAVRQELLEISSTRARLAKEISLMRTLLDGFRAEHSG
jgi:ATP-dependent Lon protease